MVTFTHFRHSTRLRGPRKALWNHFELRKELRHLAGSLGHVCRLRKAPVTVILPLSMRNERGKVFVLYLLIMALAIRGGVGSQVPHILAKGFASPVTVQLSTGKGPLSGSGVIIYQSGQSDVEGLENSREAMYLRAETTADTIEAWLLGKVQ